MTELEKMKRARMYIHKMAQGVDPLTDRELPEDTLLNNVRLSRCFFYVSEVLDRVIENGGEVRRSGSGGGEPFFLTAQERARLAVLDRPVSITEFTKHIGGAVEDLGSRKKLTYKPLQSWLMEKGFLQTVTSISGHARTAVCGQSELIGIFTETREGSFGSYEAILYSPQAQEFLLDHLEEILGPRQDTAPE